MMSIIKIGKTLKKETMKYLKDSWNILSDNGRLERIKSIISCLQKSITKDGVTVKHDGYELNFKNISHRSLNVKIEFVDKMGPTEYAEYNSDTNTIRINRQLLFNRDDLYQSLIHEFTHKLQDVLRLQLKSYEIESKERRYLLLINSMFEKQKIDSFGLQFNEKCYIDPTMILSCSTDVNNRHKVLYRLNILERNAFAMGDRYGDLLVELDDSYNALDHQLHREAIMLFKNTYCCEEYSDRDIYRMIDNAYLKILNKSIPENDREATLMYDITVLVALTSGAINIDKYKELTNEFERERKISEAFGDRRFTSLFHNINALSLSNEINEKITLDFHYVNTLSEQQRKQYPLIMLRATMNSLHDHPETKDLIPDEELFWQWYCVKGRHGYLPEQQEYIAEIFEERFHPEYCEQVEEQVRREVENEIQEHMEEQGQITHPQGEHERERMVFTKYDQNWPTEFYQEEVFMDDLDDQNNDIEIGDR